MGSEPERFDHGWPYWPREGVQVRLTRCPECGLIMQTDVTVRGDGQLVCPQCYVPFDPEDA